MLPLLPAAGQVPRHLVGGGHWSLSLSSSPSTSPLAPPPAPLYASTTTSSPHAFTRLLSPQGELRAALPKSDPTHPYLFMALLPTSKATSIQPSGGCASAHRETRKHHAASLCAAAVPDPDNDASDGLASVLQPLPRVLTVSVSQCLAGPAALYDQV